MPNSLQYEHGFRWEWYSWPLHDILNIIEVARLTLHIWTFHSYQSNSKSISWWMITMLIEIYGWHISVTELIEQLGWMNISQHTRQQLVMHPHTFHTNKKKKKSFSNQIWKFLNTHFHILLPKCWIVSHRKWKLHWPYNHSRKILNTI